MRGGKPGAPEWNFEGAARLLPPAPEARARGFAAAL
jgi:hypothetical protein